VERRVATAELLVWTEQGRNKPVSDEVTSSTLTVCHVSVCLSVWSVNKNVQLAAASGHSDCSSNVNQNACVVGGFWAKYSAQVAARTIPFHLFCKENGCQNASVNNAIDQS